MNDTPFRAMVVTEVEDGRFVREITQRTIADLPEGDVVIRVAYSALNYKDALSATGNKGVTRNYPHTPGIDASGTVAESRSPALSEGTEVLITGYDLGMNTAGGFGQYIRVPAEWVVPLPGGLSMQEAMIYGTAGFTAGMSIQALLDHGVAPESGEILVTGATGGVGSLAVALLSKIGFDVAAVTGKSDQADFLAALGASTILSREDATDTSPRPMLKGRWAGVVDTVGGDILATAIKSTRYGATVTCCGLVASPKLQTSVFPFILRAATLVGIESAEFPMPPRLRIWEHLAGDWKFDGLADLARTCRLEDLDPEIDRILKGQLKGRLVVDLA